ncbi:hypothetical protein EDB85DRAFT_1895088 [Lactarius pseudohatsudake]|nr:hypothetical protein EDB85DRAFT_1895088 [Lactarius pseudohatsudake]
MPCGKGQAIIILMRATHAQHATHDLSRGLAPRTIGCKVGPTQTCHPSGCGNPRRGSFNGAKGSVQPPHDANAGSRKHGPVPVWNVPAVAASASGAKAGDASAGASVPVPMPAMVPVPVPVPSRATANGLVPVPDCQCASAHASDDAGASASASIGAHASEDAGASASASASIGAHAGDGASPRVPVPVPVPVMVPTSVPVPVPMVPSMIVRKDGKWSVGIVVYMNGQMGANWKDLNTRTVMDGEEAVQ